MVNNKMKIGIITFHCSYNFGSALQAWALYSVIQGMGHDPKIIDYRGRDFNQYKIIRVDTVRGFLGSIASLPKNIERKSSFESFLSAQFRMTPRYGADDLERMESELPEQFDCFVCGSDQIWNLDCTGGPVAPFFLSFACERRRVAYAPSLSHTSFSQENFGPVQQEWVRDWLSDYFAISVREASTAPLFQPLASTQIDVCLDPTLLLDAHSYAPITSSVPEAAGTLFVYMLERNDQLVAYAGRLAREMGVAVSYVSRHRIDFGVDARNYYGVGPSEFLGLIRDSAAVVTNSFHATVFSLLFGTPFQTFATEHSGSRMIELLSALDEDDHLFNGATFELPVPSDVVAMRPRLERLRASSRAFLCRALAE